MASIRELIHAKLNSVNGLEPLTKFFDTDIDDVDLSIFIDLVDENLTYHESKEYKASIIIIGRRRAEVDAAEKSILSLIKPGEKSFLEFFIQEMQLSRKVGDRGRSFYTEITLSINGIGDLTA